MKDALTEAMDVEGLRHVLGQIIDGSIHCVAVDTPVPSQFSHEILNANPFAYLDDAPLEERRARAVEMRRMLPESVLSDVGRLDAGAIEEIRAEAWPDVRDAEELHDALQTLIALPEISAADELEVGSSENTVQRSVGVWREFFDELVRQGRAARALVMDRTYWVTAERARLFGEIFPEAKFATGIADVESSTPTKEDALLALIAGWTQHCGPFGVASLAALLALPANEIEKVILRLEGTGAVLRGRFSDPHSSETEWCERRLLARIHRLTVGKLRKEIESLSVAQFMRWLLRWQHLTPETQLFGEHGMLEVLRQLQGFEAPANAWERQLLSRRIAGYDPKILDQLCFNGAIGWGRLSPGPAIVDDLADRSHRIAPTGAAPITFFTRDESDWMMTRQREIDIDRMLSLTAKEVFGFLKERGASFFADILRGPRKGKEEIEAGLWELVAAGLITADGFDNLRALIDPKRRDLSNGRDGRPRYSAGRWSLLFPTAAENRDRTLEALCWVLLKRYGVVFREVLMRESNLPNWREILITLRRLEDRGEVRGGRFVAGFLGEQFALPAAVESLRATRAEPPTGETITISAADPLNLVGIVVPGAKVLAIASRFVTYRDGVALEDSQPIDYAAVGQAG
jgi:ATP-dependent Lhr-like helicase